MLSIKDYNVLNPLHRIPEEEKEVMVSEVSNHHVGQSLHHFTYPQPGSHGRGPAGVSIFWGSRTRNYFPDVLGSCFHI